MKKNKPQWQVEIIFTDINSKQKKRIINLPSDWNVYAEKNLNPYRKDLKTLSFWNTPLGMMEIKLVRNSKNSDSIPGFFMVDKDIFIERVKRFIKENKKIMEKL